MSRRALPPAGAADTPVRDVDHAIIVAAASIAERDVQVPVRSDDGRAVLE